MRKAIEDSLPLDTLVILYSENKEKMDECKKVCDSQNKEIKSRLNQANITSYTCGNLEVAISVRKTENFNEDKLLDVIKAHGLTELISTKEYVDMDKLESAMFNNTISKDILKDISGCREIKETQALTVKKVKEK